MAVAQVRAGANYGGYFTKGYYGTYPRGSAPTGEKHFFSFSFKLCGGERKLSSLYIRKRSSVGEGARRADPPER